jgi:hypothetical protein
VAAVHCRTASNKKRKRAMEGIATTGHKTAAPARWAQACLAMLRRRARRCDPRRLAC